MSEVMLSLFLYFPDDKSEYIPAAITCLLFLLAAILTMKGIIRYSKKEEMKAKRLEEKIMRSQIDRKL